MRLTCTTLLFIFLSAMQVCAQRQLSVGVETGLSSDIVAISDEGNELTEVPLRSWKAGGNIDWLLNSKTGFTAGIAFRGINHGYGVRSFIGYGTHRGSFLSQFKLAVFHKINLYKQKLFITPTAGLVFSSVIPGGDTDASFSIGSKTDSIKTYSYTYFVNRNYLCLLGGFSLDIPLGKKFALSIFNNYILGASKVYVTRITYQHNQDPFKNGFATYTGSCYEFGIKLNYTFAQEKESSK